MKSLIRISAILVLLCLSPDVFADTSDQIAKETFMTFARVSGLEKQYSQMVSVVLDRIKSGIVTKFQSRMSQENIPADLKQKLYPLVNESASNIRTQFEAMFNREITFDDLVANVYLPIYRKHFTESELKELIAFYGSPIGVKVSKLVNTILMERSELFMTVYNEKIQAMSRDIIEKEMERIRAKLKEMRPDNNPAKPERI